MPRAHILSTSPRAGNINSTAIRTRSEEHTSELQSQSNLVCRLLLEKKTHIDHSSAITYSHTATMPSGSFGTRWSMTLSQTFLRCVTELTLQRLPKPCTCICC